MPVISSFLGILIQMYYKDHNPPHFHVKYNEHLAVINVQTLEIMQGSLPKRIKNLVVGWGELHNNQLMDNWNLARLSKALIKIDPLR